MANNTKRLPILGPPGEETRRFIPNHPQEINSKALLNGERLSRIDEYFGNEYGKFAKTVDEILALSGAHSLKAAGARLPGHKETK